MWSMGGPRAGGHNDDQTSEQVHTNVRSIQ